MIADAAPHEHAKAARWPQFTMHWGKAMAVALGAPALVTLLAFTSVRTVVPGLLYVVAIILATAVGGRIGGLVAVAASAYPFFHFFAHALRPRPGQRRGRDRARRLRRRGAVRQRGARARARRPRRAQRRAVRESESALDAATRLQNVADALATAHTPQEVLDAVLTEGVRAAEARGGLIATLSDDGEWLEVIASRGYDMQYIEPFRRFPVSGNFPLSEAVRTGEGVFIRSEAERDERYPELVGRSQPGHGSSACRSWASAARSAGSSSPSRPTRSSRPSAARSSSRSRGRRRSPSSGPASRRPSRRCASGSPSSTRRPRCSPRRSSSSGRSSASPSARRAAARRLVRDLDARRGDGRDRAARRRPPGSRAQALGRGDADALPHRPDRRRVRPDRAGDPHGRADLPPRGAAGAARRGRAARPRRGARRSSRSPSGARSRCRSARASAPSARSRSSPSTRQLDDAEFELAQQLGARAAIAVENARLYREAERRAEAALALAYVGDGVVLLDERRPRALLERRRRRDHRRPRSPTRVGRRPAEVAAGVGGAGPAAPSSPTPRRPSARAR